MVDCKRSVVLNAFDEGIVIMDFDSIVMVLAVVVWLGAEAYLILKDRARGMGTTGIDRRTRNYNSAATVVSLTLGMNIASKAQDASATVNTNGLDVEVFAPAALRYIQFKNL